MRDGWVKVYRKIQDNWLWHKGPFSYGQAWIDLIMMANRKEGLIFVRGVQIAIQRGQVGMSVLSMAARWMWSRKAVETFLNRLETAQQIEQQKNRISSVITILNYEEYQSTAQQIEHQERNRGATGEQQQRTNKKEKKEKKEKNMNFFSASDDAAAGEVFYLSKKKRKVTGKRLETFDQFWDAFDYKKGRAEAADAWMDIPELRPSLVAHIVAAAKSEAQGRPGLLQTGKTPIMAQGWLSGKRWEDYQQKQQQADDSALFRRVFEDAI